MTKKRRAMSKPNRVTIEKKVGRIVRDHGDSMLDPHWAAKHATYYGVTERTLRQWRSYAIRSGLIPTQKHNAHREREIMALCTDLGMPIPAFVKIKVPVREPASWITGLRAERETGANFPCGTLKL